MNLTRILKINKIVKPLHKVIVVHWLTIPIFSDYLILKNHDARQLRHILLGAIK